MFRLNLSLKADGVRGHESLVVTKIHDDLDSNYRYFLRTSRTIQDDESEAIHGVGIGAENVKGCSGEIERLGPGAKVLASRDVLAEPNGGRSSVCRNIPGDVAFNRTPRVRLTVMRVLPARYPRLLIRADWLAEGVDEISDYAANIGLPARNLLATVSLFDHPVKQFAPWLILTNPPLELPRRARAIANTLVAVKAKLAYQTSPTYDAFAGNGVC
jgi:hypothetical protein